MSRPSARVFSREFKEAAVGRILAGEKVRALAIEQGGAETLVPPGRPPGGRGPARGPRRGRAVADGAPGPSPTRGRTHRRARAQGGPASGGAGFFRASLAARQGVTSVERREWRQSVFALIQAMTPPQGPLAIEGMCALAGVRRATYYLPALAAGDIPGGAAAHAHRQSPLPPPAGFRAGHDRLAPWLARGAEPRPGPRSHGARSAVGR